MANSKGPSTFRNMSYSGKNSLLPPKSPFPSISPSYTEYIPASAIGAKKFPKPNDVNPHHQRTSSESCLIDEQPSWLDELLDEPESPVRRVGHRRSSSDSFAYIDPSNVGTMNYYLAQGDANNRYSNMSPLSSWGSQDFDIYRDARQNAYYMDLNNFGKTRNKMWDPPALPRGFPSPRGNNNLVVQNGGSLITSQDLDKNVPVSSGKEDVTESGHQDPKGSGEKKDASHVKSLETDNKRSKQQFAQRSRVRKLQYIAELERNVQALQAEGSEVSAELEFINQQNLILSMENKALKQRLDSLTQEQLIKYLEHEVLEREVGRLRNLYQQQQQQPQTTSSHRRANSRDLDQQFANLSLKPKEANTHPIPGQLHM